MFKKTYYYDDYGFLIVTPEMEKETEENDAYVKAGIESNERNNWHKNNFDNDEDGD